MSGKRQFKIRADKQKNEPISRLSAIFLLFQVCKSPSFVGCADTFPQFSLKLITRKTGTIKIVPVLHCSAEWEHFLYLVQDECEGFLFLACYLTICFCFSTHSILPSKTTFNYLKFVQNTQPISIDFIIVFIKFPISTINSIISCSVIPIFAFNYGFPFIHCSVKVDSRQT